MLKKSHCFIKIYSCYGRIILETGAEFSMITHVITSKNISLLPVKAAISTHLKNVETEFSLLLQNSLLSL